MCSQGPLRVIEKRNSFKKEGLVAYHRNFFSAMAGNLTISAQQNSLIALDQ